MWIQNVPYYAIEKGLHDNPGENSVLIQIVDPGIDFPKPMHSFKEVHKFQFMDIEDNCEEFVVDSDSA